MKGFPAKPTLAARVYVGNLPWSVSETRLKEMFDHIGLIHDLTLICDKETNKSKGFGFIVFAKVEDSHVAIKTMNGKEVDKRLIKVSSAVPRSTAPQSHPPLPPLPEQHQQGFTESSSGGTLSASPTNMGFVSPPLPTQFFHPPLPRPAFSAEQLSSTVTTGGGETGAGAVATGGGSGKQTASPSVYSSASKTTEDQSAGKLPSSAPSHQSSSSTTTLPSPQTPAQMIPLLATMHGYPTPISVPDMAQYHNFHAQQMQMQIQQHQQQQQQQQHNLDLIHSLPLHPQYPQSQHIYYPQHQQQHIFQMHFNNPQQQHFAPALAHAYSTGSSPSNKAEIRTLAPCSSSAVPSAATTTNTTTTTTSTSSPVSSSPSNVKMVAPTSDKSGAVAGPPAQ